MNDVKNNGPEELLYIPEVRAFTDIYIQMRTVEETEGTLEPGPQERI